MAYSQPEMDDVFDDEGDDDMIMKKDWTKTQNEMRKIGYRQGLAAGQEQTQQQGFDAGYLKACTIAFTLGRLQGRISASTCLHGGLTGSTGDMVQNQCSTTVITELQKLSAKCHGLQQSIAQILTNSTFGQVMGTAGLTHSVKSYVTDQNCCGNDDGLGEVTNLLGAMGVQELPPVDHPTLMKSYMELLNMYDALLKTI